MTATLRQSFETVPDAAAISAGNSGGSGSNAANTISKGATSSMVGNSAIRAHGSRSLLYTNTSGESNYWTWTLPESGNSNSVVVYLYITAWPGATEYLCQLRNTSAGVIGSLVLMSTGRLRAYNASGAQSVLSTVDTPLNTWVRVEARFVVGADASTGQIYLSWYALDSGTPSDSPAPITNTDCGILPGGTLRVGRATTVAAATSYRLDDIAAQTNSSGFIGPVPTDSSPMSTTDREYAALAATYGPGLSLQDMRYKKYGGPGSPVKSEVDLEYAWWGPAANISMNDKVLINLIALTGKTGLSVDDQRSLVIT